MLTLVCKDEASGTEVRARVSRAAARSASALIHEMLENDAEEEKDEEVPLHREVSARALLLVAEYMVHHENDPPRPIAKPIQTNDLASLVGEWDARFTERVDVGTLLELLNAANYLDATGLLELCCCALACRMFEKNPDELRDILDIKGEMTPDERRQVYAENPWIFEQPPDPSPPQSQT